MLSGYGNGAERTAECERSRIPHEDLRGRSIEPEEAEAGADQGPADDGKLAGPWHEMDLQIFGEQRIADEIGDEAEGGGGDHHRHDGEAVETIGEVHGVAGTDNDEGAEGYKQPAEVDQHVLEEGNGECGGERRLADRGNDPGGNERDGRLDNEPYAPAGAFHRLAGHFEVVVIKADGTIDEGNDQHHPDIRVMQIAPEQRGDGHP